MRIGYLINSMEGGGAALPVPAVLDVLTRHGADVRVFALSRRDGRAVGPIEAAGATVEICPHGEKQHLQALVWTLRRLRAWDAEVIWTSLSRATLLGQIAGGRLGRPVVSWQHAGYLKPANLALLRARRNASALWIGDSRRITELTAQRIAPRPGSLVTWPLFATDPDAPQASPWRPGTAVRLGALGRLHPVKGYDVLVAALARLRAQGFTPPAPFTVEIAGDGAERERLQQQVDAAGLRNVHLVGFKTQPKAFLATLHLYLQPSRSEGLCVAAHEAMQAGLPLVASQVGEMIYSVRTGETGFATPPNDPEALAGALAQALADPGRLEVLGRAARDYVSTTFSAQRFDQTGAEILDRIRGLL